MSIGVIIFLCIVCFLGAIFMIWLCMASLKKQKSDKSLAASSDLYLKTTNIKYFGNLVKNQNGFLLKLDLEEVYTLSEVSLEKTYIGYLAFTIVDSNGDSYSLVYNPIEEYKEGELQIGSDIKSVKKDWKLNLELQLPSSICVNGSVDLLIDVTGFVYKNNISFDEKIKNLHLKKDNIL